MPRKTAKQVGVDQMQSEILLSDSLSVVEVEEEKTAPKQVPVGKVPSRWGGLLQVMNKHRWVMFVCMGIALGGAWLTTLGHVSLYTSVTTLLLEPDPSQNGKNRSRLARSDYYQTQYAILQSRALAAQVIQKHGLEAEAYLAHQTRAAKIASSGFIGRLLASTRQLWSSRAMAGDVPSGDRSEKTPTTRAAENSAVDLVETYQSLLAIEPIQNTRLVRIAFQAPDPLLSAQLANAHASAYLSQDWQLQTEWGAEAEQFLKGKLADVTERLNTIQASFRRAKTHKKSGALNKKDQQTVQDWAALNTQLKEAEAERTLLEVQIYLAHKGARGVLPTVVSNAKIEALADDLDSREAEYARHLVAIQQVEQAEQTEQTGQTAKSSLEDLKSKVEKLQKQLEEHIEQEVQRLGANYQAIQEKEKQLKEKLKEYETVHALPGSVAIKSALLSSDAEATQDLYDTVVSDMRGLVGGLVQAPTNATVLDEAKAPLSATNPQHGHPLVFGVLIGLLGGIGFTFFLEYRDDGLKTPRGALPSLQLAPVSSVPDFENRPRRSRYSLTMLLHTLTGKQQDMKAQISGRQEKSPLGLHSGISLEERGQFLAEQRLPLVTQAYQAVCSALSGSRVKKQGISVLFTSAVSGEGTTLIICHSALLLAQMGHKVLVIDANHRKATGLATDPANDWVACHTLFGAEEGPGLTDLVTGRRKQRVVKSTAIKNLSFLSRGTPVSGQIDPVDAAKPGESAEYTDVAELLSSPQMAELLASFRSRYDYILIDAPPVLAYPEAALLSATVDGVVLVADGQTTSQTIAQQARAGIDESATIIGVVLNRVCLDSESEQGHVMPVMPLSPSSSAPSAASQEKKPKSKTQAPSSPERVEPIHEPGLESEPFDLALSREKLDEDEDLVPFVAAPKRRQRRKRKIKT